MALSCLLVFELLNETAMYLKQNCGVSNESCLKSYTPNCTLTFESDHKLLYAWAKLVIF